MSIPLVPRYLRLPLILAAIGVAAIAAGIALGTSTHQAVATGSDDDRVTTPVLSARRVPGVTSRGIAVRRLEATVGPRAATVDGDFCFTVAANGTQLVDVAGDQPLLPGSNMKLATALAALEALDPDSTLTTEVAATAEPAADGTVNGDLFLVGGGDPLISTPNYVATSRYGPYPTTSFEALADQVVQAGVRRVTGRVVGDDSRYDGERTVATWPDRYVADNQVGPLSALAVNDAKTYPVVPGASGGARPAADPPAHAAQSLVELLRVRGVVVDGGGAAGQAPARRTTLVDVPSLTVRELVAQMLTFSDNNTAELLLKELGRSDAAAGSTAAGIERVERVLDEAGVATTGLVQADGSGLDRGNRATCRALQSILTTAGPDGDLAAGLAVAGTTGTLRDRMEGGDVQGRIRAKTGTLRDVTALSGWVEGRDGTDVVFAFVLNTGGRQVSAADLRTQEQLAAALRSYPDSPDPATLGPRPAAGS